MGITKRFGLSGRTFAGDPSNAIYGTIIVAGLLVGEESTHHSILAVVLTIIATLVVFWMAHAYAHVLGGAAGTGGPTRLAIGHTLRAEWPIVETACSRSSAWSRVGSSASPARTASCWP